MSSSQIAVTVQANVDGATNNIQRVQREFRYLGRVTEQVNNQAAGSYRRFGMTAQQVSSQAVGSLNRVGEAATRNAQSQERASRSIERALQREIALLQAGERGSRAYYESLARQRGADTARLTPLLNQLDGLRQRTDGLTISQGQYNAALRTMPAQMTDIVTQLAGGQNPFLIAIQQGGQMRDSFGGFGNMFRGIAASVSPFKLAMAGAVGAVGAVGFAMYKGSQEGRELQNVLTLSGNRAGVTTDRLQALADSVGDSTQKWGVAREAVLAFAKAGQIAESDYAQFARAVTYYSQATGADVGDLVAQFTKIGDDPVKAVVELSKQYRSMTSDVYAQVSALVEQGKETEAVRLIQQKMADEMERNGKKVVENLGYIEKGWLNVKNAVGEAWQAMKNWGREQTISEQIAAKQAELAALNAQGTTAKGAFGFGASNSALEAEKRALRDEIEALQKRKDSAEIQAAYEKQQAETQQKTIAAQNAIAKTHEKTLSQTQRLVAENKKLAEQLALVEKAGDKIAAKKAREAIAYNKREIANIAARERQAAERESRVSTRGLLPTTADGLRLKAGAESGGKSHAGTYAIAHAVQKMLGTDLMRFGSLKDNYRKGKTSAHNSGLGFDATPNARMSQAQMAAVPQKIKAYLAELGFSDKDFFVQFENAGKRNKNGTVATGNHWHFNWRNQEAAAKFASMGRAASDFAKGGLYKSFEPTKVAQKSDYEQYVEQSAQKQLRAEIERELRTKGDYRVFDNERDLRSRPEFKNWTKDQQNSELAKARAADELATQEKIKALADQQIAQLTQKQALLGKNSELSRLEYELVSGSLKHLSDGKKAEILTLYQTIEAAQKQYDTDKKYGDLLDSLAQKNNEQFSQKAFELSLLGKSKSEIDKLTLAREYDLQIMQATVDGASAEYIDGLRQQQIAAEAVRQKIQEMREISGNDWLAGVQDGVTEYIGNFKTMREGIGNLVSQTANGFTDQIAEFVATGKANFREFTQSVIADISKMMIKMAIFNAMKAGAESFSGSENGILSGVGGVLKTAFGFSDGGFTGVGGKYEPAGIVHKGEYVLSQDNLRVLGGVSAVENLLYRAKGYSNGGLVGGGFGGLASVAQSSAAPIINITVNVSGDNAAEAEQGAKKGVQAALPELIKAVAAAQIAENCRPNGMIFNLVRG